MNLMSSQSNIFTTLDIGSSKVLCTIVQQNDSDNKLSVIGVGMASCYGVKRGQIVEIDEVVTSITKAVEEAETMSGITVEQVLVNINGYDLKSMNISEVVAITNSDHLILDDDIKRSEFVVTSKVRPKEGSQILSLIPQEYAVDGVRTNTLPLGQTGQRLETTAHIITCNSAHLKTIEQVCMRAGLSIREIRSNPELLVHAAAKRKDRDLGALIIDFGAETTGIAVVNAGKLVFTDCLPLGSNHITKDISFSLKTNIQLAEKIKLNIARASKLVGDSAAKFDLSELGLNLELSQIELDQVVFARLQELFEMIRKLLDNNDLTPILGSGAIITGGGSNLKGLEESVRDYFNLPVRNVSYDDVFLGLIDKLDTTRSAIVLGGVLWLQSQEGVAGSEKSSELFATIKQRISKLFKSIIP